MNRQSMVVKSVLILSVVILIAVGCGGGGGSGSTLEQPELISNS